MDNCKTKKFIGFKHVEDGNSYWVNQGYIYDEEVPYLFPFSTKEDVKNTNDLAKSYIENWKLKKLTGVVFLVDSEIKFFENIKEKTIFIEELDETPKKRTRKTKQES